MEGWINTKRIPSLLPILRELMGKYLVTGFWITRKSFSRLPTAVILSFCNSCTAEVTKKKIRKRVK